jgi:hypothetical protein
VPLPTFATPSANFNLRLGTGPRLGAQDAPPTKWSLTNGESYANGIFSLGYRFEPSIASVT